MCEGCVRVCDIYHIPVYVRGVRVFFTDTHIHTVVFVHTLTHTLFRTETNTHLLVKQTHTVMHRATPIWIEYSIRVRHYFIYMSTPTSTNDAIHIHYFCTCAHTYHHYAHSCIAHSHIYTHSHTYAKSQFTRIHSHHPTPDGIHPLIQ